MKSFLNNYVDKICNLSEGKLCKEDILNSEFFLKEENKLKIYYAPHNEFLNKEAKILIVGICPGWTQTEIAFREAKIAINNNKELENILKKCKISARFAGSMRNNLISMLDELCLSKYLGIDSVKDLFDENKDILHTTSLIPYPVFVNGKNYTGHMPEIIDSSLLMEYVKKHFYEEIELLENKPLIIPLGKSVEEVLKIMVNEGIIKEEQCLFGFPHPSGANGHRKEQFMINKDKLKSTIDYYFKSFMI